MTSLIQPFFLMRKMVFSKIGCSGTNVSSQIWQVSRSCSFYRGKKLRPFQRLSNIFIYDESNQPFQSQNYIHSISLVSQSSNSTLVNPGRLFCANNRLYSTTLWMTPAFSEMILCNNFRKMSTAERSKVGFSSFDVASPSRHSNTNDSEKNPDESKNVQLTTREKVQRLFKKYGLVFVGTYFGIYVTTLLSLFGLLDSGLLDPDTISQVFKVSKDFVCETADVLGPTGSGASMDEAASAYAKDVATEITKDKRSLVDYMTLYLQKYEWSSQYVEKLEQNPHLANLAVAWVMIKFTEPIRLAMAVMVVPKVAKMLGRKIPKDDIETKF